MLADRLDEYKKYAPGLNFLPRICGTAYFEEDGFVVEDDGTGIQYVRQEFGNTYMLTCQFTTEKPKINLQTCSLWEQTFSQPGCPRVYFSTFPTSLVSQCIQSLRQLGRTVDYSEAFRTWAPAPDAWEQVCADFPMDASGIEAAKHLGLDTSKYKMGPLQARDAELVNETWKYHTADSVHVVRRCIEYRPSSSVRLIDTDEPVSWIIMRNDGSMGVMYTLPEYRKQGLGHAVALFMMVQIQRWKQGVEADLEAYLSDPSTDPNSETTKNRVRKARLAREIVPFCHIAPTNPASESIFKKLNFQPYNEVSWIASSGLLPRFAFRPLNCSSEQEWSDLLNMINVSYREDDKFFVDQIRANRELLTNLCENGIFFVAYSWDLEKATPSVLKEQEALAKYKSLPNFSELVETFFSKQPVFIANNTKFPLLQSGQVEAPDDEPPTPRTLLTTNSNAEELALQSDLLQLVEGEQLLCCFYLTYRNASEEEIRVLQAQLDGKDIQSESPMSPPPQEDQYAVSLPHRIGELKFLTINSAKKKNGVGSKVLNTAIHLAKNKLQCSYLMASVVSVKPWLFQWYEKNGFVTVGQEPFPPEQQHELILPTFFHRMCKPL